ncbi:MAG: DegV family protein [Dehalococcoidia bacterium]|nr:DegV family protein [Dehalococcoidia bacterium]
MTVRVVTDSTGDLPHDVAAAAGLTVVPLNIHFGTETLRDGVDITPDAFYARLVASKRLPTTSQPSAGAFVEAYQRLARDADAIVSVHISAKLSGTYNSALQAVQLLDGARPVDVLDTQQASLGLGLIALAAARVAKAGGTATQVVEEARRAMGQARFFGVVDTLEYLEKGGRIGKAQAFLGNVLKIKPVLAIQDGVAHPVERCRTMQKALDRLVAMVEEAAPIQELGVLHSTTPEAAQALAERVRRFTPDGKVLMGRIGPVVGTYLGPGALGVGLLRRG